MTADPIALPYVDTSALAKRYLNEPFSLEVDAYLGTFTKVAISTLTLLELRCLLARRRRNDEITSEHVEHIRQALQDDVDFGSLRVLPTEDHHLHLATSLVDSLAAHGLRSRDAMHLGIAESNGARTLATADIKMADAATAIGMDVVTSY